MGTIVRPQVLVAATHLTGRAGVEQALPYGVTYLHLLFDAHELIRADGTWTESFQPADRTLANLDTDQRAEIAALFPDLSVGQAGFPAARTKSSRASNYSACLTVPLALRRKLLG